jgi:hypothetical protein
LVRGLKERVIAVNGDVLSLDDILDFADRLGRYLTDSLKVIGNEHEIVGIDMPLFDEAPGLLVAAAGIVLVHQAALVVHEAVQIAAGTSQALPEIPDAAGPAFLALLGRLPSPARPKRNRRNRLQRLR